MKWGGNMPPQVSGLYGLLPVARSATGLHQARYLPTRRECLGPMLQAKAAAVWGPADHARRTGLNNPLAVGRGADHAGGALLRDRPPAIRPLSDHAAWAVLLDLAAIRPLSDGAGRTVLGRIDPVAVGRLAARAGRAMLRRIDPVAMGRLTAGAGRALHGTTAPPIPGRAHRAAMAVGQCLSVAAGRRRRRRRGEWQALVADPAR